MMKKTFLRNKMVKRPTLQSALTDKYCIRDTLLVEGIFVRMYPEGARDLVSLGISNDNFIVARVIVTGYDIDFELISVSPLCRLDMDISKKVTKEITVTSAFKTPQFFQLCTSAEKDALWLKFVRCMEESKHVRKDTWMDVQLETAAAGGDHSASMMYSSYTRNAEKRFTGSNASPAILDMAFTANTDVMNAELEVKFDMAFTANTDVMNAELEVKFDQFVNDANPNCHMFTDQINSQDPHCSTKGWRKLWLFRKILDRKKRTC